jgi:hypothetical protein
MYSLILNELVSLFFYNRFCLVAKCLGYDVLIRCQVECDESTVMQVVPHLVFVSYPRNETLSMLV